MGRVICLARTGRNLLEYVSDDECKTWTAPKERIFAGLDVNRTELWVDFFRKHKDFKGKPLSNLFLTMLATAGIEQKKFADGTERLSV